MDDFSDQECRQLAEIIHQIIVLMQKVDHRTTLPVSHSSTAVARTRKVPRRTAKPKPKTSMTMVCPAPMKASPKTKRTSTRRMTKTPASGSTTGTKTMGFIDATGACVCPMPARGGMSTTAGPPGLKPGYTGPITRSMTAAMRKAPVTRRAVDTKMTVKKGLKMKDRKKKVRRQNRKRPAMKKGMTRRGAVMECP